jgi:hypothetical protein
MISYDIIVIISLMLHQALHHILLTNILYGSPWFCKLNFVGKIKRLQPYIEESIYAFCLWNVIPYDKSTIALQF